MHPGAEEHPVVQDRSVAQGPPRAQDPPVAQDPHVAQQQSVAPVVGQAFVMTATDTTHQARILQNHKFDATKCVLKTENLCVCKVEGGREAIKELCFLEDNFCTVPQTFARPGFGRAPRAIPNTAAVIPNTGAISRQY